MNKTDSPRGRWLALLAALLGWMFDGMEMGLFPQVGSLALKELLGPATPESIVGQWFGIITAGFLVGAATGGVLFGWLGDKVGRVRAMTLSVFVYAGCSGACGFAQEPWQLALLRFLGALGMGGEWALGVALVMELWPNTSRALLAGLIGAFGNLGYAIVGLVTIGLNSVDSEVDWLGLKSRGNWRLIMLVGVFPAVLTLFIRLFVPESHKWQHEQKQNKSSHWAGSDLLMVLVGAATGAGIITVWAIKTDLIIRILATFLGLLIAVYCYIYPARRYMARSGMSREVQKNNTNRMLLAASLSGVPLLATWGGVMWVYTWLGKLTTDVYAKPITQISSSFGAALGCFLAAVLGGYFGRRPVYAVLCLLSGASLFCFYTFNTEYGIVFVITAGLVGFITAAFYGWLPLYLPELFPTEMRATGQGFGFNFGRILAAVGSLQTAALLNAFDNDYAKACSVAAGVYLIGFVLIWFAPETKGKPLPE